MNIILEQKLMQDASSEADRWLGARMEKACQGTDAAVCARVRRELLEISRVGGSELMRVVAEVLESVLKPKGLRMMPGRGRINGSLVAYLLGISAVDPLRYGIPFETWIPPEEMRPLNFTLDVDPEWILPLEQALGAKLGPVRMQECIRLVPNETHARINQLLRNFARDGIRPPYDVVLSKEKLRELEKTVCLDDYVRAIREVAGLSCDETRRLVKALAYKMEERIEEFRGRFFESCLAASCRAGRAEVLWNELVEKLPLCQTKAHVYGEALALCQCAAYEQAYYRDWCGLFPQGRMGSTEADLHDPEAIKLHMRRLFGKLPEERALIAYAQLMTSKIPFVFKLAVWEAVRYRHVWWRLDELLVGEVLENPTVQAAFADTPAVRAWRVAHACEGWRELKMSMESPPDARPAGDLTELQELIYAITHGEDSAMTGLLSLYSVETIAAARTYFDINGNNLLWYLTYRQDLCVPGGYACPKLTAKLLSWGIDPQHRNALGLCWNDVAHHINPERK